MKKSKVCVYTVLELTAACLITHPSRTSTRNLQSSLKGSTRLSSLIFLMTSTLTGALFQVSLWLTGSWMCLGHVGKILHTHTRKQTEKYTVQHHDPLSATRYKQENINYRSKCSTHTTFSELNTDYSTFLSSKVVH